MNEDWSDALVLFVDDEPNILRSIQRGLWEESYQKRFVESGEKALEIMSQEDVWVVVTDMRMPGMNGLELLQQVQERFPDVVRIILTGYSQVTTLISAINTGRVFRYLTKPWKTDTDFIPTIRQALEYRHMIRERQEIMEKLKSKNLELNRQNLRIHAMAKQVERSDGQKGEIIQLMTREIIPFINEVVRFSTDMEQGTFEKSAGHLRRDIVALGERGLRLHSLLLRVESLLARVDPEAPSGETERGANG